MSLNLNPYTTNNICPEKLSDFNVRCIYSLKILSDFSICCIYSDALQTTFDYGSKHYEP